MNTKKCLLIATYSLLAIFITMHLVQYFHLTNEDAFIGFRYTRNFAEGYGLVTNPGGTTQEGFSNLSEILIVGSLNRITNVDILYTTKIIGVLSTMLVMILCYLIMRLFIKTIKGPTPQETKFTKHLAKHEKKYLHGATILSATAIGLSPFVSYWTTQGMETMFYSAVVMLILYTTLVSLIKEKYNLFYLIAALSFFSVNTRPEGLMNFFLFLGIAIVWLIINRKLTKKFYKHLIISTALYLIAIGIFMAWKVLYFGDFLSNPARIKLVLKAWKLSFGYIVYYFQTKGVLFSTAFFLSFLGSGIIVLKSIFKKRNVKISLFLAALLAFISSQFFFSAYVRGDYMPYYRFLVTHYPFIVLLAIIFALSIVAIQKKISPLKALAGALIIPLALLSSIFTNENIPYKKWHELDFVSPYKLAKTTLQYQTADKINNLLSENDYYATSEFGILPFFAKPKAIDITGLGEKYVARNFKNYTIREAGYANRDYVLSKKPKVITSWGHYMDENGNMVFSPAVSWFLEAYFQSDFFLEYYDGDPPKSNIDYENELGYNLPWGFYTWNDTYQSTNRMKWNDTSHTSKLMYGFHMEDTQIWTSPLARIVLQPTANDKFLTLKGFIPDISRFNNNENNIEIFYNKYAVGDETLITKPIRDSGPFEIKVEIDKNIFPPNEEALITIRGDYFQPGPEDTRPLSYLFTEIYFSQ